MAVERPVGCGMHRDAGLLDSCANRTAAGSGFRRRSGFAVQPSRQTVVHPTVCAGESLRLGAYQRSSYRWRAGIPSASSTERGSHMRIAAATSFIFLSSLLLADESEPVEAPTVRRSANKLQELGASILYWASRDSTKTISVVVIRDSWKGGDEGVDVVQSLARLHSGFRTLYIVGQPSISEARLERFKRSVPNVSITRRSAAQLGVGGSALMSKGFQILTVMPNSPAEDAGLEIGDVVTELDGKPVRDFQTLVELLLPKRPGDAITLTVLRSARERSIEVELGEW